MGQLDYAAVGGGDVPVRVTISRGSDTIGPAPTRGSVLLLGPAAGPVGGRAGAVLHLGEEVARHGWRVVLWEVPGTGDSVWPGAGGQSLSRQRPFPSPPEGVWSAAIGLCWGGVEILRAVARGELQTGGVLAIAPPFNLLQECLSLAVSVASQTSSGGVQFIHGSGHGEWLASIPMARGVTSVELPFVSLSAQASSVMQEATVAQALLWLRGSR